MNNRGDQTENTTNNCTSNEAFFIFFNGSRVAIEWKTQPPPCSPILRLCSINPKFFLLLNGDKCLYEAKFDHENIAIQMNCIHQQVIDIQYCKDVRQVFMVTGEGSVLTQCVEETTNVLNDNLWKPVIFDPLELSEEGVRIKRVCCSSSGSIFLSNSGDVYALGNCGTHFSVDFDQPKLLRLFKNGLEILDISAGDQFFVFLTKKDRGVEINQPLASHEYGKKIVVNNIYYSHVFCMCYQEKQILDSLLWT